GVGGGRDEGGGHGGAGCAPGIEEGGKERLAGDRVQHFRPRRTHAGAFAGRKHNGKTGTLDRQWTSSAARFGRRRRHIRVRRAGKGVPGIFMKSLPFLQSAAPCPYPRPKTHQKPPYWLGGAFLNERPDPS